MREFTLLKIKKDLGEDQSAELVLEPCLKDEISDVRQAALRALAEQRAWSPHTAQCRSVLDLTMVCFQGDSRDYVREAAGLSSGAAALGYNDADLRYKVLGMYTSALVTEQSPEVMKAIGTSIKMVKGCDSLELCVTELLAQHTDIASIVSSRTSLAHEQDARELMEWVCLLQSVGAGAVRAVVRRAPGLIKCSCVTESTEKEERAFERASPVLKSVQPWKEGPEVAVIPSRSRAASTNQPVDVVEPIQSRSRARSALESPEGC